MTQPSAVGVVDKVVEVLDALHDGPASLAMLVERTGLARPTAYRLAVALEHHGYLQRDGEGRFGVGARLAELGRLAAADPLLDASGPVLDRLRNATHESAQLYRAAGHVRRCIAVAERPSGLRDTVPVGAELPMSAGSAAQVLLAWREAVGVPRDARFTTSMLATVRRRGWASSVAEREAGVASVSAPVFDRSGAVVAAVSVSGPIDRLTRSPGRLHATAVVAAGQELTAAIA